MKINRIVCSAAVLASALFLTVRAGPVVAAPVLRILDVEAFDAQNTRYVAHDVFANGDPKTGLTFSNCLPVPCTQPGYRTTTFSAGSELNGPAADLVGTLAGSGGLSFKAADAGVSNTNLTPSGFNSKVLSESVQVPPSGLGLLQAANGFDVSSVWNFVPADNVGYGLRLQGGSDAGAAFQDIIDLRVMTNGAGVASVNLERVTFDGSLFSRILLGTVLLTQAYPALADIDYIQLDLNRDPVTGNDANPDVHASFALFDAQAPLVAGNPVPAFSFDFAATPEIFHDTQSGNRFALFSARATFLEAVAPSNDVPEPGSFALFGAGMAALTLLRRRKRR